MQRDHGTARIATARLKYSSTNGVLNGCARCRARLGGPIGIRSSCAGIADEHTHAAMGSSACGAVRQNRRRDGVACEPCFARSQATARQPDPCHARRTCCAMHRRRESPRSSSGCAITAPVGRRRQPSTLWPSLPGVADVRQASAKPSECAGARRRARESPRTSIRRGRHGHVPIRVK